MSSLYQLYKHKDKNGTGTVVNKTYTVPLSELYVEPGLNIREIDQDHVAEFRDAFIAGESVPPLDVQVTEKGVKVIDVLLARPRTGSLYVHDAARLTMTRWLRRASCSE